MNIPNFKGCFYKDKLKKIQPNSSYIINLNSEMNDDGKRNTGSHWTCLVTDDMKETAGSAIGQVYDKGVVKIGNTKHFSGIADVLKKGKGKNVSKLTQMSGLGLRLQGEGVTDAMFRKPITLGDGLTMGGMCCKGCGMAYNDKFIFGNQSL